MSSRKPVAQIRTTNQMVEEFERVCGPLPQPNKRYVRADGDMYRFCVVGADRRIDLAQGTVAADQLPADVKAAADARRGFFPSYVDWPL